MFNYESVIIENVDNADIYKCLKTLLTTPQGTVPFDRNFGINTELLDEPLNYAKGKIISEYYSKIKKYEPRVKIKEIFFVNDYDKIIPKVVIENA